MGKVTQLNIWNSSLSTEFMKNWSNCNINEEGDLLKWEKSQWKLEGTMSAILTEDQNTFSAMLNTFKCQINCVTRKDKIEKLYEEMRSKTHKHSMVN